MTEPNPLLKPDTADEVLLDVAALIELSPRDRRVADNRYRLLKTHLERERSKLRPYLVDGESRIYSQGSIATSTTIVSGTDDDRFDVDAIVEIDVPADWDDDHALDLLEESLQGFPGAAAIVRRTRCVQIQFPFMHMDVAILDRRARLAIPRAGEIFHSPDTGASMRVSSNPWGFTGWFRLTVGVGDAPFTEALRRHRQDVGRDRLPVLDASEAVVVAKAEQDDLPPMIPSRLDAQQAVALKLLKRNLNISYAGAATPRPPSIYVTKRAADIGYIPQGLTAQLYVLASDTAKIMRDHLDAGTQPEDLNPSYPPDRITDRWPRAGKPGETDMRTLAEALEHLGERLAEMATAPLAEIAAIVDELFGERIGKQQRAVLAKRYDRRDTGAPILSAPRTGGIYAPAIAPASAPLVEVPRHNFHAGRAVKIR